ncbi:unnamed protein product, partial [Owenia fusiformis]
IDQGSGDIRVSSYLDYDVAPQSYKLVIKVSDKPGTGSTTYSSTMTLTVNLDDVNDNSPVFSKNAYSINIDESISTGTSVISVSATDNDSSSNGQIRYTIVGGDGVGIFSLATITGEITSIALLDFETKQSYTMLIKAKDLGTPSKSSLSILQINVNDVNDNMPTFQPTNYLVAVDENQPAGIFIATVGASDSDTGANAAMAFVINAETDPYRHFTIGSTSGVIQTTTLLDRE